MRRGDKLVVFTDGLTGLKTGPEQRLGDDGVASILRLLGGGSAARLSEALLAHAVEGALDDDIVLMILEGR